MLKAYKTEIQPNETQLKIIHQTIGTCRWIYNKFIETNQIRYENKLKYMNGYNFSKWLNNEFIPNNPDKLWIKESASKAVKQSIMNAHRAYQDAFKKQKGFPKFKKKQSTGSYYLIGNIHCERHRIKLPKLGWIRLKEKGYIPNCNIKSTTVSKEFDRYYVSVLVDERPKSIFKSLQTEGIGLDLGLKDTLFTPNGVCIKDLRKNKRLIILNKSLKRQQRKLSRKKKKSNNWFKQLLKVQRLYRKIKHIKQDIKRKSILSIVQKNPQYITIENLNIKGLTKNRNLSNAFQQVGLGYIVEWLKQKCYEYGIELRQVNRFYPSSQLCSQCNHRQKMPLHKRIYKCEQCGFEIDRDINASINLKQALDYTVIV
ncbi:RNA-guided endonuclease InsQ/TnpB family protein [Staphylococcus hominis]|uniref:RNA-guided endonuclease InsQ/TnpB family protein n=1 Tax=Staphylococcus hominis TaxID=1290 RepID=UPI003BF5D843